MIDIHCHILAGIDDGPADIDESVEMVKTAFRDGISTIVATPHVRDRGCPAKTIYESVKELNRRIGDLGIPLTILRGADVSVVLDPVFFKDYTIEGTEYILLEFPHSHIPGNAKELLFTMATKGLRPIITHPERNTSVLTNPALLLDLVGTGPLIQITAESLTGDLGPDIRECATYLLRRGVVSFLATDAHSNTVRRPILSEGLKVAEKIIGREGASRLVRANPQAVIQGRPVESKV